MSAYTESVNRLIGELSKLPGIGSRSAERLAFHLLKLPRDEALGLADAIRDIKEKTRHCSVCYNLTESDPCTICGDPRRDHAVIAVVEQPKDLLALEQTGLFRGVYHVLLGHIAPLEGVEPDDLTINHLLKRVRAGAVGEVLIATSPTLAGDGTALHLHSLLRPLGVKVTRLARGLPAGSEIEHATRAMLEDAITGRRDM